VSFIVYDHRSRAGANNTPSRWARPAAAELARAAHGETGQPPRGAWSGLPLLNKAPRSRLLYGGRVDVQLRSLPRPWLVAASNFWLVSRTTLHRASEQHLDHAILIVSGTIAAKIASIIG
jgi:hypothetical protein